MALCRRLLGRHWAGWSESTQTHYYLKRSAVGSCIKENPTYVLVLEGTTVESSISKEEDCARIELKLVTLATMLTTYPVPGEGQPALGGLSVVFPREPSTRAARIWGAGIRAVFCPRVPFGQSSGSERGGPERTGLVRTTVKFSLSVATRVQVKLERRTM